MTRLNIPGITALALLFLPACKHYFGNPYPHAHAPKTVPAAGDALRLEPPNWWVGMTQRRVEVLVCRPGIRAFETQLGQAQGVTLEITDKSTSPDSFFLTLQIAPDAPPQRLPLIFTNPVTEFQFTAEFPIFRRNTAPKAQGLEPRHVLFRPKGKAELPVSDLNRLQDWGFTAIWLPAEPAANLYGTNRQWNTPDLFRNWVRQCHYRDIRVVRDMIPPLSGVDPCSPEINSRQYDAILQQALWWVEHAGLDGFRLDSCPHTETAWLKRLRRDIRAEYPVICLQYIDEDPFKNILIPGDESLIRLLSSGEHFIIPPAVLLTSPGLPVIFTDMDSLQTRDTSGFVRALIRYRNATPALQTGQMQIFPLKDGVYAWFRSDAAKTVLVLLNTSGIEKTVGLESFATRMNGFTRAKDAVSGSVLSGLAGIRVPGNAVSVLEMMK